MMYIFVTNLTLNTNDLLEGLFLVLRKKQLHESLSRRYQNYTSIHGFLFILFTQIICLENLTLPCPLQWCWQVWLLHLCPHLPTNPQQYVHFFSCNFPSINATYHFPRLSTVGTYDLQSGKEHYGVWYS